MKEQELNIIKKYVPIKFIEIEKLVPVEFIEVYGKYIPVKFESMPEYIPVEFAEIEMPILFPASDKNIKTKNLLNLLI